MVDRRHQVRRPEVDHTVRRNGWLGATDAVLASVLAYMLAQMLANEGPEELEDREDGGDADGPGDVDGDTDDEDPDDKVEAHVIELWENAEAEAIMLAMKYWADGTRADSGPRLAPPKMVPNNARITKGKAMVKNTASRLRRNCSSSIVNLRQLARPRLGRGLGRTSTRGTRP